MPSGKTASSPHPFLPLQNSEVTLVYLEVTLVYPEMTASLRDWDSPPPAHAPLPKSSLAPRIVEAVPGETCL